MFPATLTNQLVRKPFFPAKYNGLTIPLDVGGHAACRTIFIGGLSYSVPFGITRRNRNPDYSPNKISTGGWEFHHAGFYFHVRDDRYMKSPGESLIRIINMFQRVYGKSYEHTRAYHQKFVKKSEAHTKNVEFGICGISAGWFYDKQRPAVAASLHLYIDVVMHLKDGRVQMSRSKIDKSKITNGWLAKVVGELVRLRQLCDDNTTVKEARLIWSKIRSGEIHSFDHEITDMFVQQIWDNFEVKKEYYFGKGAINPYTGEHITRL